MNEEKLVALLYLLMRDHLPVGAVTAVVTELEDAGDLRLTFTNGDLEACARELLGRLR